MARRDKRGWGSTVAGIAILAVLLFPLYWMVNVSLQPGGPPIFSGTGQRPGGAVPAKTGDLVGEVWQRFVA
ncbi:hypothetical protein [Nonomuraea sp. NPDC049400]|uniref:hypothetical protein n=1 Tax=Nonomuraea sp. NPDC049400 TaxID=3364352 RepID=UPI00379E8C9E